MGRGRPPIDLETGSLRGDLGPDVGVLDRSRIDAQFTSWLREQSDLDGMIESVARMTGEDPSSVRRRLNAGVQSTMVRLIDRYGRSQAEALERLGQRLTDLVTARREHLGGENPARALDSDFQRLFTDLDEAIEALEGLDDFARRTLGDGDTGTAQSLRQDLRDDLDLPRTDAGEPRPPQGFRVPVGDSPLFTIQLEALDGLLHQLGDRAGQNAQVRRMIMQLLETTAQRRGVDVGPGTIDALIARIRATGDGPRQDALAEAVRDIGETFDRVGSARSRARPDSGEPRWPDDLSELSRGSQRAHELGWPPPEPGYTWGLGRNGQPYYRRLPGHDGPQRFYDVESGIFVDTRPESSTAHLPDVRENYTPIEATSASGNDIRGMRGRLGRPGHVQTHRDRSAQRAVSSGTGDDAGHFIGNRFGAPGGTENLGRQNWIANQYGTYSDLEDSWDHLLQNGYQIDVEVRDFTRPGEDRPFLRKVEWTEIAPDGSRESFTVDFGNFSTPRSRAAGSGGSP